MSGHVRQRGKKGQWYAVIDVLGAGKRIRRWHKLENCKGKREAEKACERLIAQQAEGTYVDPSRMTVADFLERWIEHMEGQVSPRSHERYAELCRNRPPGWQRWAFCAHGDAYAPRAAGSPPAGPPMAAAGPQPC